MRISKGCKEKRTASKKLTPTIKVTATSIKLKVKQSTSKIKVSGFAKGDSGKSWTSSNKKIVSVNSNKTMLSDSEHPNPVKRKGKLFAIVDRDEYDFDTIDGNHLYGGFLDVYDEYRDQVFLKKEKGKLDKIIHTERRNRMRR